MFFKSPNPDYSGVAVHGKQFDVVAGFIEILEEEFTPAIEATLASLGFVKAEAAEVSAVVTEVGANEAMKTEAAERAAIIEEIRSWGLRVDARKGLAWLKECYEKFVAQGHIKPGEKPGAPDAPAVVEPIIPLKGGPGAQAAQPVPEPVFEDDPAAETEGAQPAATTEEPAAETTGEAAPAAS